jgi:hypothetical protein
MATISFLIKVYVYLTIMFFLGNLPSRLVLNPARWYTALPNQIDDTTTNNTASRGQIQYLLKV